MVERSCKKYFEYYRRLDHFENRTSPASHQARMPQPSDHFGNRISPAPQPLMIRPLSNHFDNRISPAPQPLMIRSPSNHFDSWLSPAPQPLMIRPLSNHFDNRISPDPQPLTIRPPSTHFDSRVSPAPQPLMIRPPSTHFDSRISPAPQPLTIRPPYNHFDSRISPAPRPLMIRSPSNHVDSGISPVVQQPNMCQQSDHFDNRTTPVSPVFVVPHPTQAQEMNAMMRRFEYLGESDKPEVLGPAGDDHTQVSEQIWTKFQTNQQTRETFMRKLELWRNLSDCIHNCNSHFRLAMVGSTVCGLGTNTSDVDMCLIFNARDVRDARMEAIQVLYIVSPLLESVPHMTRKDLILAKVPILKLRHTAHSIDVDINVNNWVGLQNSLLLHSYTLCDWRVRPLVIVVKLWAHAQEINDAKQMTLSSYSLTLMVIHFLQHGLSPPILPCLDVAHPEKYFQSIELWKTKKVLLSSMEGEDFVTVEDNTQSLGELLLGFLEYFAVKFDYRNSAISVRSGEPVSIRDCASHKAPKNDKHQWKYFGIEEPFESTNTARSVYDKTSFDRVRGVIFTSWQRLQTQKNLDPIFDMIPATEAKAIGARVNQQYHGL